VKSPGQELATSCRSFRRAVVTAVALAILASLSSNGSAGPSPQDKEAVGPKPQGREVLPVGQIVTPYGLQSYLPGVRPQALALSPDGKLLAVSGKTPELIILNAQTGKLEQEVELPAEAQEEQHPEVVSPQILDPDVEGQLSYTGLIFAPNGRRIYLSNVMGSVKVFNVDPDGHVEPSHTIRVPHADAPRRAEEIPAGLALSLDGHKLYVCGNLSNRLLEIDVATGGVLRTFDVGVAPFDVVLAGDKAYVSNWGGRRPRPDDLTGPAGLGTVVKVDPVRYIAGDGSVSVIDLAAGRVKAEIEVHLHPSALALSPDGRWLVCANAASDNLSVIDTAADTVAETIWAKSNPADLFGASPNALAFDPHGRTLYVANGTQNAVAAIDFNPARRKSTLKGLVPVGWFPGALAMDRKTGILYVANIKGLPVEKTPYEPTGGKGFNSYQYHGSISIFPEPRQKELWDMTPIVEKNYRRERIAQALLPARPGQPARPVPERIGEPSVFKHVVYVIKENRTYDQVLGDVAKANGDPALCIFGENVTPNQHKLVQEFALLDNTYCCGILSADGHQWSTTAFGTDYLERSFAGWPRSYPDGMGLNEVDALAYAPSGFIWDNALKHGVSLWNFGEFTMETCGWTDPSHRGNPAWANYWDEYLTGRGEVRIGSQPAIPSVAPFSPTDTLGWNMDVPDQWRARYIITQLAAWEKEGRMPQLILVCLPDDHTSGTAELAPTPEACAADNDLAFGRIVEAFSHSSFWKETVIFGIEDDPQNGWDHVSGYRTTAYCASPYTKRGAVVSAQYNTTSLLRTIEQILGLPPMNQFDATATPMFDCFTEKPDSRPFDSVPTNIPLDTMNPLKSKIADPQLRRDAAVSGRLNFRRPDACPEDTLNRILWRAVKGPSVPYPSWAVTLVVDDRQEAESAERPLKARRSDSKSRF
jgi:YVTN family beta-propeller protein